MRKLDFLSKRALRYLKAANIGLLAIPAVRAAKNFGAETTRSARKGAAWHYRGSSAFSWLSWRTLRVHRGRKFRRLTVRIWHWGNPLGLFARTRATAVFKKKTTVKKQKKVIPLATRLISEAQIAQIKAVQMGKQRRSTMRYLPNVELQLRNFSL